MTMILSQCFTCERFDRANTEKNTCSAFPKGIPNDVFLGQFDHTKPYPGDNGLRYVAREDEV